jgi:hypothetical protein
LPRTLHLAALPVIALEQCLPDTMIRFLAVRHSARVDFGEKFCQVLSSQLLVYVPETDSQLAGHMDENA